MLSYSITPSDTYYYATAIRGFQQLMQISTLSCDYATENSSCSTFKLVEQLFLNSLSVKDNDFLMLVQ